MFIIVCTEYKSVFFGHVPEDQDLTARTMALSGARMALYWGTTGGVGQLARTGPTPTGRVGDPADIVAHGIHTVYICTPEAAKAWVER